MSFLVHLLRPDSNRLNALSIESPASTSQSSGDDMNATLILQRKHVVPAESKALHRASQIPSFNRKPCNDRPVPGDDMNAYSSYIDHERGVI